MFVSTKCPLSLISLQPTLWGNSFGRFFERKKEIKEMTGVRGRKRERRWWRWVEWIEGHQREGERSLDDKADELLLSESYHHIHTLTHTQPHRDRHTQLHMHMHTHTHADIHTYTGFGFCPLSISFSTVFSFQIWKIYKTILGYFLILLSSFFLPF